jgi:hypothetical protein
MPRSCAESPQQRRSTHPGEQGVIICDGVGTHLGYNVVRKAIDLGMEILLRFPHPSFVLQGEDTMNFKVKTTRLLRLCLCFCCCCYCACLPRAAVVAAAAAVATAATAGVAAAKANADADDACSDADALPETFDAAAYADVDDADANQTC